MVDGWRRLRIGEGRNRRRRKEREERKGSKRRKKRWQDRKRN
jgi:hypothetical protein